MTKKKGDILNQLAIISDLLENVNIEAKNSSVLIEVDEKEFDRVKEYLSEKQTVDENENEDNVFAIIIGEIDFVFSKNSV